MSVTDYIAAFAEFLAQLISAIKAFINVLKGIGNDKEEVEQG